jgi:hypothetical protein
MLTMRADLTLRLPREDEEQEFLRAHRATSPEVPYFLHYYSDGMPFRRYLEVPGMGVSSFLVKLPWCF